MKRSLWMVVAGLLALRGVGLSGVSQADAQRVTHTRADVVLEGPRIVAVQRAQTPARTKATILRLDVDKIRQAHALGSKFRIRQFPLDETESVELELQPFGVAGHNSRFVIGRLDEPDIPFPYDVSRISFIHGRVFDRAGSHVYLSLSDHSSSGYIDLGSGAPRYRISSKDGEGRQLGRGLVSVFKASGSPAAPASVPLCGVEGDKLRRGDSLWELAHKTYHVPPWLIQRYNFDIDLTQLTPGADLIIPVVEPVGG